MGGREVHVSHNDPMGVREKLMEDDVGPRDQTHGDVEASTFAHGASFWSWIFHFYMQAYTMFSDFPHSHRPTLFCITFSNVLACTCILYILFQMTSYPSIMSLGALYVWSVLIVIKWTSAYPDTQGTCGFQTFSIHYEMFAYLEFCSYMAHFRGWSFLFNRSTQWEWGATSLERDDPC